MSHEMVHMSGLEQPTPRLSGVCSDRLSYTCIWWTNKDLNLEPIGYEPIALTVVLLVHISSVLTYLHLILKLSTGPWTRTRIRT